MNDEALVKKKTTFRVDSAFEGHCYMQLHGCHLYNFKEDIKFRHCYIPMIYIIYMCTFFGFLSCT
jgi:hypothetical protein